MPQQSLLDQAMQSAPQQEPTPQPQQPPSQGGSLLDQLVPKNPTQQTDPSLAPRTAPPITSAPKSFLDEAKDTATTVLHGVGLPGTREEAHQANQALAGQFRHPINTAKGVMRDTGEAIKGMLQPNDVASLDAAKKSWADGNKVDAARHFADYIIPLIGQSADKAGDSVENKEWGKAVGHTLNAVLPFLFGGEETHPVTSEAEAAKAAAAKFQPTPEPTPEAAPLGRGTVKTPSKYGLRPASQTTAGVEAPVSAVQAGSTVAKAAENLTTPGLAEKFQKEQTIPAAQRQAVSTVGQVGEDQMNRHDAIVNGEALPDQITGTQVPSKFQTFDDIAKAMEDKAVQTTYKKADQISARETQAWQEESQRAIANAKEANDHYNGLVDEHNAQLQPGQDPLEHKTFDPHSVELPEKPSTYSELKGAVDRAKADSRSADAAVRGQAFETDLPKAEKALDQWFKSHSDEISPEEYQSAKQLRYSAERFKEIANGLRRQTLNNNVTGNAMRGIEATMDNRKNLGPGTFQKLLGPEAYQNWREVSRLFDPIHEGDPTLRAIKNWGQWGTEYVAAHLLGPLGLAGKAASEYLLNRVMFNADWGKWFRDAVNDLRGTTTEAAKTGEPVRLSPTLAERFKALWKGDQNGQRGMAGADINKPQFGRKGLGGAPETSAEENPDFVHQSIADWHNQHQGFSYNPAKGFIRDQPVFSVAGEFKGPEYEKVTEGRKITPEDVKEFMERPKVAAALQADPDLNVGGWNYKGKANLELSKMFEDKEKAIAEGKRLNQDSIYDHAKREGIDTGGTAAEELKTQTETPEYAGEERRAARRPPMNATELEAAMKNRKPIETPFDVTEGAQATINRDPSMPQRNPQAVTPTYTDRGNGLHEVSTGADQNTSVGKGILLAQDVDGNPDAVRVAAHWVAPDARGQGVGTSQLETLAKSLTDKTTLLSDKDMTDAAKGAWDKFQAAHPDAITKTPSGGYIADLDRMREGSQNSQLKAAVNPTRDTDAFAAARAKLGPDATLSEVAQEAARAVKQPEPSLLDQALTPNKDESEIATRRPTSTKVTKNNAPGQYADMAGVEAASKATPGGNGKLGYAEKMARTIAKYSGIDYTDEEMKDPRAVMEKFINRMTDNLVSLHDAMPEPMRKIARQWYGTANKLAKSMGDKYGYSHEQAAGVLAALSPQNAWDNNVALADRLMDAYKNRQNFQFSPKMEAAVAKVKGGQLSKAGRGILKDIQGKTLAEIGDQQIPDRLKKKWGAEADNKWKNIIAAQQGMWVRLYDEAHNSPENPMFHPSGEIVGVSPNNRSWIGLDHIAKAIRILNDGRVENINDVMGGGNKIRNFYNNIINPNSKNGHVTIDTHAVGAALFQPLSGDNAEVMHNFSGTPKGIAGPPKHAATGMQGTYPLYAEAYRRAAEKLGLQPRELQSITWEGIRSLMGDDKKTPELKSFARDQWDKVQNRELTIKQARENIMSKAGGFTKPDWMTDEQWDEANGTGFNPEEFK